MANLPDYLQEETESAILQRMLDLIPADIDKAEGGYIWDALAPAASELAQAAIWAREVLRRTFAETTFGQYLDLRVSEHGLTRRPAVPATGMLKISGAAGTVIPGGTCFATPADEQTNTNAVLFETTADVTIGTSGYVNVLIRAVEGGKRGNVVAGAITVQDTPVDGVSNVMNETPTTGGLEAESDEELLARFLFKVRNPATSGNKNHYILWAMEVPGVGGVSVIPLKYGPGTVDIAIIDQDKNPAGAALVQAVRDHIAALAPIGASVTVSAAVAKPIDISVKLVLKEDYTIDIVGPEMTANIDAYLRRLTFTADNDVRYVRISQAILDTPGVHDYAELTVNGGNVNIAVEEQELAVLGTVTVA